MAAKRLEKAKNAPVAQWIEQRFPKPRAQVRFLPGASRRRKPKAPVSRPFRSPAPYSELPLKTAQIRSPRLFTGARLAREAYANSSRRTVS
jgi:hypothetical protein